MPKRTRWNRAVFSHAGQSSVMQSSRLSCRALVSHIGQLSLVQGSHLSCRAVVSHIGQLSLVQGSCLSCRAIGSLFDCGKGMAVIRSVGHIQIGHWNSIFIQRQLRQGYVRLNSESVVEGKIDGDFSRITLRQELFLGGYVNMSAISSRVGTTKKFSGCIQELVINSRKYDMRKDPLLGNAVYGTNVGK
ncbi:HSPG2 [Acanthosepion pharaonis]|uniref:HSPG2 n=1 Tax=Acanthosepion pharaonis TaxID=158019 RepID=A0A812EBG3_ACAPH|nr:HSPG2 [Sepia pharaonis]